MIEAYLDEEPFPSYLTLDFVKGKPIHVVLSYDQETGTGYVVTAYVPSFDLWEVDFKTRKPRQ